VGVDKQNNGINLTSVSCFLSHSRKPIKTNYGRPALRLKTHRSAFGSQAPPGPAGWLTAPYLDFSEGEEERKGCGRNGRGKGRTLWKRGERKGKGWERKGEIYT